MTASWAPAQTATVFGGIGFLGRRVVRRLREAGFAVRIAARNPESGRLRRGPHRLTPESRSTDHRGVAAGQSHA